MSSIASAILRELSSDDLAALADRLRPFLTPTGPIADKWIRGGDAIAAYLDCPKSRVYALSSAGRIKVERDGSALIARTSDLDAWLRGGGAKRS